MLSSLAQLQKVLQTEVGLKYANKAVIGGLPKLMTFWEPNARRDGLSPEFISDVASRLRTYVETDLERRPAALGEILDAIKAEQARRTPPPAPVRPRDPAPPPRRVDEPRPAARGEGEARPRPESTRPQGDRPARQDRAHLHPSRRGLRK